MASTFHLDHLVRPNIKALQPYHSARAEFSEGLLLDANENSLGSPFPDDDELHRYPDPAQEKLRDLIAQWRGVRHQNVFTGVGSDEGIDLLFRIFCRPGKDRILTTPPTYGMYGVSANIHDIAVDQVLLQEDTFQLQVDKMLDAVMPNTKLLLLCSPNNPTGNSFSEERVTKLVEEFSGIVVLDEAYIDFSTKESWARKVATYPNLVVLQTMSKSFGLAGIRLGMTFANEDIIRYMMKVKAPYNVNKLTARHAIKAFKKLETIQFNIDTIKKERKRLRDKLDGLNAVQQIYPSDANFLLVKIDNAKQLYEQLANDNIIVRYRGNEPLCENCLRITVGTPDENERLISVLKKLTV